MKRLITAFLILLSVSGLCILEFILSTREADYAAAKLEQAQEFSEAGKREDALKAVNELRERWESGGEKMLILISHEEPEEIGEDIAVLESYLKSGELPEFYAECKRTENKLRHFRSLEIPGLNNIL